MVDNVILGLDFLTHYSCLVDLQSNTATIKGEIVDTMLKRTAEGQEVKVNRVSLQIL